MDKAFVLKKQGGRWERLQGVEADVGSECVQIRGMADGFDRLACLGFAGPNQGYMSEAVEVLAFAQGQVKSQRLLGRDHGGECDAAFPPKKAEYVGDSLSNLSAADPASETAFTIMLEVRRLEGCEPSLV